MSRGADRPVQMRALNNWYNPDDYGEAAYGPPPGAGGRSAAPAAPGPAAARGPAGRAPPFAALNAARGAPAGAPPGASSRYDTLASHAEQQYGNGRMPVRASSNGPARASPAGRQAAPVHPTMARMAGGGGGVDSTMTRGSGGDRVAASPPRRMGSIKGMTPAAPAVGPNGGGGSSGAVRQSGGGPGPAPARGPPSLSSDQIPDRPGTKTTVATERDGRGCTITTKTVVTRTNSGRIRTEITTTTSGPAHLVNGSRGAGVGGAVASPAASSPVTPGTPSTPPWMARGGGGGGGGAPSSSNPANYGSYDGSPAAPSSPVTPVRRVGTPSGAAGQGSLLAGPGGGGTPATAPRLSSSGSFSGGPPLRTSLSGMVPAAPLAGPPQRLVVAPPGAGSRPSSATRADRPASARASPGMSPPPQAAQPNVRNSWGGVMSTGSSGSGSGAGAPLRPASPARHGPSAAPPSPGRNAPPSPSRNAPPSPARLTPPQSPAVGARHPSASSGGSGGGSLTSTGRMKMSAAFAAAHGLGSGSGSSMNLAATEAALYVPPPPEESGSVLGGGLSPTSPGRPLSGRPSSGRSPASPPAGSAAAVAAAARMGSLTGMAPTSGAAAGGGSVGANPQRVSGSGSAQRPSSSGGSGGSAAPPALLRNGSLSRPLELPAPLPGNGMASPAVAKPTPSPPSPKPASPAPAKPSPPAAAPAAKPSVPAAAAGAAGSGGSKPAGGAAPLSLGGTAGSRALQAAASSLLDRKPHPPPAQQPSSSPTGSEDPKARVNANMAKVKAAAKMFGTRTNAGLCAVSLAFLRRFRALLLKQRPDAARLPTCTVVMEVIKPMTTAAACRLTDLPDIHGDLIGPDDVGQPEYFISHAWSMAFLDLLDCVFNHLQGALDSTRVWLDIFAVNQHPGAEQRDDLDNLRTAIKLSQATLVCLDSAGTPLERVWCLYEFDNTLALKGADALVLLTPGFSIREIASIFRSIDVDAAKATVLTDKDMILKDIVAKHGSTQAFNTKLKLRFLLDPLDMKPDLTALAARAGTDPGQWDFSRVAGWLGQGEAGPQVAVLQAAAGTGKSTITAVLCMGPEAAAEIAVEAKAEEAARQAAGVGERPPTAGARPQPKRPSTAGLAARRLSGPGGALGGAGGAVGAGGGVAVHAYHFCKYSDARRQDPVRVVKTLAYQLAHSLPALQPYYCGLDPGTLMQLHQPDAACRELLMVPLQKHARGQQILIVLDALDEADKPPAPHHPSGSSGRPASSHGSSSASAPSALDNKVLQLLLHQLSQLPRCVRILTTTRPEKHLVEPLRSRFRGGLLELVPSQLRRMEKTQAGMQTRLVERFGEATAKQLLAAGGGGGGAAGGGKAQEASMVYFPVVLLLRAPLDPGAVPAGLYAAYAAVFDQMWPKGGGGSAVQSLLEVLVAAQEPPPMSLLAAMGLQGAMAKLPGWGVLFFERDHHVHVLHRTLFDWLQDRHAAGPRHADARRGHSSLGRHLLAARPLSLYGARYLVTHLIQAGSEPAMLDSALQDLGYLEAACRSGDPFKLHAELAALPEGRTTRVVQDVVRWLGLNGHVLWSQPGAVQQLAAEAPRSSTIYQVASKRRSGPSPCVDLVNEPPDWPLEVLAITQHKAPVPAVAYSPDGSLLSSASLDGSVRLFSAATGEPKAALAAPPAHCLAYSPTGHVLATGGEGGMVQLWDPTTGVQVADMRGYKDTVTAVAVSGDGKVVASGGRDKAVRLWSAPGGQALSEALKGHTGPLHCLAFSADGALLASAAEGDAVVRLWNVKTGQLQAALEGHRQAVTSLAFAPRSSPAGPHLLASAADCVRLWDAAAGAAKGALTDHIFPVVAVAFTPDGSMLLSADTSHTVRLWAVAAGGGAAPPPRPASVRGRGAPFGAAAAAASGTAGFKQLAVMETESSGHLTAMAISPDGRVVATGSAAGELNIFAMGAGGTAGDGAAGGGGGVSTVHAAHAGPVRHVAFSPSDPRALVSSSDDCTLRLWDTRTALKQQGGAGEATAGAVVFALHFCRGGAAAACVAEDGTLTLWDAASGQLKAPPQRVQGSSARPVVSALSPDEALLAVGDADGITKLWDLASGRLRARLKGHGHPVTALAFPPDGSPTLATGSEDCRLRLWSTASGQLTATLTGHMATVACAAFSPDCRTIASGCEQGAIRLWNAATGKGAAALNGHGGTVLRVAFSPDGRLLASGGEDLTVRLWDAGSGKQLAVMKGHKERVVSLAFGASGRVLCSGSRGEGVAGSVFAWDAGSGQQLYALHAAHMAGDAEPAPGTVCTAVSALEHAPHLTLVSEAGAGAKKPGTGQGAGAGAGGQQVTEAGGGRLRLRQVPVFTSFAAPVCVAVHGQRFAMAFGSHVYFYSY